jgi:DNA-binding beta-propeller fold protein YncE
MQASIIALSFVAAIRVPAALAGDTVSFQKEKEVTLPGGGGFDYLCADAASRRLFIAHSPNVDVIDLDKGEKIGSVEGVDGAHGAIVVPEVNGVKRGFATSGKKNALIVFDAATLKPMQEVKTGEGPDALLYVSSVKEVWTMNHKAGTITCVDPSSLEVKATIEVGGKLEFAAEHAAKGLVFVNAEDKSFIAAIDAKKHAVLAKHDLAPAEEPTGLAIDVKKGLLFAGCNEKLAVVDAESGKVIATPAIGKGCDAVAYDAEHGLVFASCGDGTTTIVRETKPGTFDGVGKIETVKGARTCALDAKTGKLWVASGSREKGEVKLLVFAPVSAAK